MKEIRNEEKRCEAGGSKPVRDRQPGRAAAIQHEEICEQLYHKYAWGLA